MKKYDPSQSYIYPKDYPRRFKRLTRAWFLCKRVWRWLRIQRPLTWLLGYQYQPASNLIEIDLTYLCNLRCHNCNRSSAQAPEATHITLSAIQQFVDDSIQSERRWDRIRLLGGEPTLHPAFVAIVAEMERYLLFHPGALIEVVSNGYGSKVKRMLATIPSTISIENSEKYDNLQPEFGPFNLAPQDSRWYALADYRNGCSIANTCGIGLTPQGYYPCAVAGGIDRVLRHRRGRQRLPAQDDEMRDLMEVACCLCGRFHDGHYVPPKLRSPLLRQLTSPTWLRIYHDWQQQQITPAGRKLKPNSKQADQHP